MITAALLASAGASAKVRSLEMVRFPAGDAAPDGRVNVREVRAYLRRTLDGTGVDLDDMDLMAAEVVTNAVRHTTSGRPGGRVWVAVITEDARVRVETTDEGGATTEPMIPPCQVLSGRGLLIVERLSDRWDWSRDGKGRTTVWFELLRGEETAITSTAEGNA
ncbi:Anti-sigma regulatory factor (Ser/Thr protein kinase) [Thermomonospora echinospora]|uniref:Anti-sigma regulatory factor (Ser/Thr protein kinase) n=1 Tax=Thermomonospora echinospora TaxID=1992 RepID=A0A1H6DMB0_9ACTN|nr:ATP-binding protein [Thermomonospora echinospora]SEG85705.1 Anti-sigma regulatory factor (Ser/Thr protein kinase) [Thermomonospora echinospora]